MNNKKCLWDGLPFLLTCAKQSPNNDTCFKAYHYSTLLIECINFGYVPYCIYFCFVTTITLIVKQIIKQALVLCILQLHKKII